MRRRNFLKLLAGLPFLGFLKKERFIVNKGKPDIKTTFESPVQTNSPYIYVWWEDGEMKTRRISASEYYKRAEDLQDTYTLV